MMALTLLIMQYRRSCCPASSSRESKVSDLGKWFVRSWRVKCQTALKNSGKHFNKFSSTSVNRGKGLPRHLMLQHLAGFHESLLSICPANLDRLWFYQKLSPQKAMNFLRRAILLFLRGRLRPANSWVNCSKALNDESEIDRSSRSPHPKTKKSIFLEFLFNLECFITGSL
jgi:hypothetical protein